MIPTPVKEILDDPAAKELNSKSPFWILVHAVRRFVEKNGGFLPLVGSIPDMTADTETYIALQEIYQAKAQEDIAVVRSYVEDTLSSLGRPSSEIDPEYVKLFCKNAQYLRLIRGRSLEQEYTRETANIDLLTSSLEEPENNAVFYVLLRAADRFYAAHGHYPGWTDDRVKADIPLLKEQVTTLALELGFNASAISDDAIHEICRFGASEMHNIAALLGGIVAQEAIKVITHQWVPMNHTLIYNGMNSTTTVFVF